MNHHLTTSRNVVHFVKAHPLTGHYFEGVSDEDIVVSFSKQGERVGSSPIVCCDTEDSDDPIVNEDRDLYGFLNPNMR
jgi:prephenate dehydrogenase